MRIMLDNFLNSSICMCNGIRIGFWLTLIFVFVVLDQSLPFHIEYQILFWVKIFHDLSIHVYQNKKIFIWKIVDQHPIFL